MAFDRQAAKQAGYSDQEINQYLASQRKPMAQTQPTYDPFGAAGNPVLEQILQGATLGFSDEIQAGLKTVADKIVGGEDKPWGETYRQNVQDVRAPSEAYQKESPMTSLGLNLLGGMGTGATAAKLGQKLLPQAVKQYGAMHPLLAASGGGATAGTISGAGFAPTMEEVPEYATSGLLTGAVLPGAMKAGGKVLSPLAAPVKALGRKAAGAFDTPQQRAARMLAKDIGRDDISLQDIQRMQAQYGPEFMMADVGPNVQALATTVAGPKGRAFEMAKTTLEERAIESPQRLVSQMRGIFKSNKSAYRYMQDTIKQRKEQASPLYKAAFEQDAMVTPGAMDELFTGLAMKVDDFDGTSIGRTLKAVQKSLTLKRDGKEIPKLQLKKLHAAKLDLDTKISDSIKEGRSTPLTAELMEVKNNLLRVMDESPNYAQARKLFSDDSSVLTATKLGKKFLSTSPDEMKDMLSGMSEAEKKGFITGALDSIQTSLERTKEGANAARKVASPFVKSRIRAAFGNDEEFARFAQGLEAEDIFAETKNVVLKGSQTQQKLARAEQTAGETGVDLARGGWLNTLFDGARNFFNSQKQIPEPVRDELAKMLFTNAASGKDIMSKELIRRLKRHDVSEQMIRRFLDPIIKGGVPVAAGETGAILEQ